MRENYFKEPILFFFEKERGETVTAGVVVLSAAASMKETIAPRYRQNPDLWLQNKKI